MTLIDHALRQNTGAALLAPALTNLDIIEDRVRAALADGPARDTADDHRLAAAFRAFIADQRFPCVGAKAALARDQIEIVIANDISSNWDDVSIYARLQTFAQNYKSGPEMFRSFAVLFKGPLTLTEEAFETHMWARLQSFTRKDAWLGHPYDARVSDDPADPHFSLSFGEEAFFVVGLHPNASRPARRFQTPAMVFNLHNQFAELRDSGAYKKMRETILKRDMAVAGSVNPMLSRFGETSEARQYSGRAVPDDWVCPFSGRGEDKRGDA